MLDGDTVQHHSYWAHHRERILARAVYHRSCVALKRNVLSVDHYRSGTRAREQQCCVRKRCINGTLKRNAATAMKWNCRKYLNNWEHHRCDHPFEIHAVDPPFIHG